MVNRTRSVPMIFNHVRFGARIFQERFDAGMTFAEVGELVGLNQSTIATYERGEDNMKVQHFLALCNLYDLDPREFFELEM